MITDEQIKEIRAILEKAERPLFLFDDDPDGLSSYLILRKYYGKGVGIPTTHKVARHNPILRKAKEYAPDVTVVLDLPILDQEFIDELPGIVLHIDHHKIMGWKRKNYHYYNPMMNDENDNRPITHWAYKIVGEDEKLLWIAGVGVIFDYFVPDFLDQLREKYPDLVPREFKNPGEAAFDMKIGDLVRAFVYALKGKASDVETLVKVLLKIGDPYEILNQTTSKGKFVYKHFAKLDKKFQNMLDDALKDVKEINKDEIKPMFVYTYVSKDDSFTSLVSNALAYRIPNPVLVVARIKDGETIMSLRSKMKYGVKLPEKIQESLEGLKGRGGGHDFACGTLVSNHDYHIFIKRFEELVEEDYLKNSKR